MDKRIKNIIAFLICSFLMMTLIKPQGTLAVENVSLFTPYTGVSASPGDTIEYTVGVINNGSSNLCPTSYQ